MKGHRGHALITAILAGIMVTLTAVYVLQQAAVDLQLTQHTDEYEQAWYLAQSALERCAAELRYRPDLRTWWPGVSYSPPTAVCAYTDQPLAGGRFSARLEKVGPITLQGRFTGRFGRAVRTLGATLQFVDEDPSHGHADLIGGGDIVFGGGGYVEGVLVSSGQVRLDGNLTFCGQAHARRQATYTNNVTLQCNAAFHSFVDRIQWPTPFWSDTELAGWATPGPNEARANAGRTEYTWDCRKHPDWCGDPTTPASVTAIFIPGWLVFSGRNNDIYTRYSRIVARDGVMIDTNALVNDDGTSPDGTGSGAVFLGVQDAENAPADQVAIIGSNARVRRLRLYVLNATVKWNSSQKSTWWGRMYAKILDAANGVVEFHTDGGGADGNCVVTCVTSLRVTSLWEE